MVIIQFQHLIQAGLMWQECDLCYNCFCVYLCCKLAVPVVQDVYAVSKSCCSVPISCHNLWLC
uniref:Uncharacterized protein n=1 Tax=Anguilla anguilla TaxID=7936 RepID=A0A0E9X6X4_ANGAN